MVRKGAQEAVTTCAPKKIPSTRATLWDRLALRRETVVRDPPRGSSRAAPSAARRSSRCSTRPAPADGPTRRGFPDLKRLATTQKPLLERHSGQADAGTRTPDPLLTIVVVGGAEMLGIVPFSAPLLGLCRPPSGDKGDKRGQIVHRPAGEFAVKRTTPDRADEGTRTLDPRLTMAVLYQLSYVGTTPNPSGPMAHQVMLARARPIGSGRADRVWSLPDAWSSGSASS
jgi:hypothetical protein